MCVTPHSTLEAPDSTVVFTAELTSVCFHTSQISPLSWGVDSACWPVTMPLHCLLFQAVLCTKWSESTICLDVHDNTDLWFTFHMKASFYTPNDFIHHTSKCWYTTGQTTYWCNHPLHKDVSIDQKLWVESGTCMFKGILRAVLWARLGYRLLKPSCIAITVDSSSLMNNKNVWVTQYKEELTLQWEKKGD